MKLHLTGCLLLMILISVASDPVAAQSTPLRGPKDATNQYSGVVFGPIDSNDTLWRVASRYRQNPNLSIYQVMVAIYELNPDAFEQNNLNLMVDGATLKLPSERYIARIDAEKARQKAEADDAAWARMVDQPGDSLKNLKPPVPLVNQEDLTQTKTQIEQQLNQIDQSQARQFEELRNQFAASIDSVQALLDDNRKLYDRIEQINEDLNALRGRVDEEVETKVDEQLALQRELKELLLSDRAAKQAEESESLMNVLTSPMALIAGTGLLTFMLFAGVIVWLMKRKSGDSEEIKLPEKNAEVEPEEGIADLSTALESDLDTNEFSDEELFNDDDLLDDVLSTELEDSLNDDDNFADLNDDMLVPDDKPAEDFEAGESSLDQDDLDSLFDDEFANEDDAEDDAIDLSDDEDLLAELDASEDNDDLADFGEDDIDELIDSVEEDTSDEELAALLEDPEKVYQTETEEPAPDDSVDTELSASQSDEVTDDMDIDAILAGEQTAVAPEPEPEDDAPEISIDDLLEENKLTEEEKQQLPVEDGPVGEEMLEKLDEEINQQSQALDRLSDSIIDEIDQIEMMGDLGADLDDEEDELLKELNSDGIDDSEDESKLQSIDALTDDLDEIDIDDIENSGAFDDPLSDELLAELEAELPEEDKELPPVDEIDEAQFEQEVSDELTDELLQELDSADEEPEVSGDESELGIDSDEDTALDDDLTEELLAELSEEEPVDAVEEPVIEAEPNEDELAADDDDDFADPLTDDLLAELSEDAEEDDNLTQTLLDELNALDNAEDTEPQVEQSKDDSEFESNLADSQDEVSDDALDQALAEFDKQLMDDIPSFSGESEPSEPTGDDDVDDDILDQALADFENEIDSFELEQEQDGVATGESEVKQTSDSSEIDELEDLPGLDDWLSGDSDSGEEAAILDELDNSEFDELLDSIDKDNEKPAEVLKLDNPDLDLNALFSEDEEQTETPDASDEAVADTDFVDVETLMAEADDVPQEEDDRELDLDVSLSEYSGITDDDDVFDIDKDAGQNANLDLARVYIEMEDSEAAKELLEEVLEKGSEAQQAEAKNLLDSLAEG